MSEKVANAFHKFAKPKETSLNCLALSDQQSKTQKYSVKQSKKTGEASYLHFTAVNLTFIYPNCCKLTLTNPFWLQLSIYQTNWNKHLKNEQRNIVNKLQQQWCETLSIIWPQPSPIALKCYSINDEITSYWDEIQLCSFNLSAICIWNIAVCRYFTEDI